MSEFYALVPAAGSGSRMGADIPKQYLPLAGRPMLYHALATLCACADITTVFVVLAPDDTQFNQYDWSAFGDKLQPLFCGGASRAESVTNGLIAAELEPDDWMLVHDAARPCLSQTQLARLINELHDDKIGGILAVPVADTLKRADAEQRVAKTENRDGLWQAQTPQMFRAGLLLQALLTAPQVTDEASAIESLGLHPKLVESETTNFKVTYPKDVKLAELLLEQICRVERLRFHRLKLRWNAPTGLPPTGHWGCNIMRIGQGFDVHQLVEGRKLIIGGVDIPYEKGLLGHSDADVLLHAICDALLGAAALGDIGRHFADTDAQYKNIDSRILLREVARKVQNEGFHIGNVDATIIAQAPKMAQHIPRMVENIAADLGVARNIINVKATTTEKLGYTGRGEGIAAQAVALLRIG